MSDEQLPLLGVPKVLQSNVEEFITLWNSKLYLPKIRGTNRQVKLITRSLTPYFLKYYTEAIECVGRSKFVRSGKWFCLDWFLETDNMDKLLEGKYSDTPLTKSPSHTYLDEYGNEQIL